MPVNLPKLSPKRVTDNSDNICNLFRVYPSCFYVYGSISKIRLVQIPLGCSFCHMFRFVGKDKHNKCP